MRNCWPKDGVDALGSPKIISPSASGTTLGIKIAATTVRLRTAGAGTIGASPPTRRPVRPVNGSMSCEDIYLPSIEAAMPRPVESAVRSVNEPPGRVTPRYDNR